MHNRLSVITLPALLLAAACSRASVTPSGPPSVNFEELALERNRDASATLGDEVRVRGSEFLVRPTVLKVEEAVVSATPASGGRLYAFLVSVDGLDPVAFPTTLNDFLIWDDLDHRYSALADGGKQPRLEITQATPDQPVRGWLTFVGPAYTRVIDLAYKPALAEEPAAFSFVVPW